MEDCVPAKSILPKLHPRPRNAASNNDPLDKRAAMVMIKRWMGKKISNVKYFV